jgi:hypothetical protein
VHATARNATLIDMNRNVRNNGHKIFRVVCGVRVPVEAPARSLTPAQRSALAASRSQSRLAITRPAVPAPRIDATAGGRFQGFRVP